MEMFYGDLSESTALLGLNDPRIINHISRYDRRKNEHPNKVGKSPDGRKATKKRAKRRRK